MMNGVVRFKSTPANWNKEKSGAKANTVRRLDTDERFETLRKWADTGKYGTIEMQNTETKEVFKRDVSDVTFWADSVIISWRGQNG